MYVFEEGGAIRGFSHVVPSCIVALFVDPDHTRRGVGRALFEHALALIRASGTIPAPFEATITALPFSLNMGCTEIRRSFVEKNHVKVETVLMQLPGKTNDAPDPTAVAVTPAAEAAAVPKAIFMISWRISISSWLMILSPSSDICMPNAFFHQ